MDSRDAVLELILELLAEDEFRDRPVGGAWSCRATCATRRRRSTRSSSGCGRVERAQPLTIRLVKGAYWDHEIVEAKQHGWHDAGVRAQGRHATQLRGADAPAARRAAGRARGDRLAQPALGRARDRLQPPDRRRRPATSSCRSCAASATRCRPRSPRQGLRVRTYCPVGDLVAGMAYLVRRLLENTSNDSFLHEQARGAPLEELLAPRARRIGPSADPASSAVKPFANEPILELRRGAGPRAARRRAGARTTRAARCGCRCGSATSAATGDGAASRPTPASPTGSWPRRRRRGRTRSSAALEPPARARWDAPGGAARGGADRGPRSGCASGGWRSPRSRCASARSRGREADARRVRGDRLPRVLRARRASTLGAGRAAAAGARRAQRAALRRRAASSPSSRRGTSRVAIPLGMTAAGAGDRQRRRSSSRPSSRPAAR